MRDMVSLKKLWSGAPRMIIETRVTRVGRRILHGEVACHICGELLQSPAGSSDIKDGEALNQTQERLIVTLMNTGVGPSERAFRGVLG